MGADVFGTIAKGKTAKEAFEAATSVARYDYGHRGYTGSIAEKHEFVVISVPVGTNPKEFAEGLIDADDRRVSDKWGPAGCVKVSEGVWYFFGWASS